MALDFTCLQTFHAKLTWYDRDHLDYLNRLYKQIRVQIMSPVIGEDRIEYAIRPLRDMEVDYLFDKTKEEEEEVQEEEEEDERSWQMSLQSILLALFYMGAMLMIISTSTDRLLRGLAEEKQNRVLETLLSSISADQLMAGKVVGLGAMGLTQFAIWFGSAFIPAAIFISFVSFDVFTFLVFLAFFLFGYLFSAVLILGSGSLGNNLQEASQYAAFFIVLNALPMMLVPLLLNAPDGLAAKILTYLPFSSPMIVVFRMGADAIAIWEIGLALLLLILSCYIALRISSKVFRFGVLMTGQKLTFKTFWRMWRAA